MSYRSDTGTLLQRLLGIYLKGCDAIAYRLSRLD